jgi:hypothetical protein
MLKSSQERWGGPIRGLRLPLNAWDMLRREGITTLDGLKAVADQLEQFDRIGPTTAQTIRDELAHVAACKEPPLGKESAEIAGPYFLAGPVRRTGSRARPGRG